MRSLREGPDETRGLHSRNSRRLLALQCFQGWHPYLLSMTDIRSLLPAVAGLPPVAGGRVPGPLMISDERLLCPARGNETPQAHNMRLQ